MRKLAEKHNIELFCLPPHTTHRTQPLDVGVFGPLQRRWQERCDEVLETTDEEIRKVDFVKEYMEARRHAFLPDTIKKAWERSGICPLNPNIFTDADFAPSASTSRHAHLPGSYPTGHDSDDSDFQTGSERWESEGEDSDENLGEDLDAEETAQQEALAHRRQHSNHHNDRDSPLRSQLNHEPSVSSSNHGSHSEPSIDSILPTTIQPTHPHHLRQRHTRSNSSKRSLITQLPEDPDSEPDQPPIPSKRSKLREENFQLKKKCKELQGQLDAATIHAKLAALEAEELQQRLNAKSSKKTTEPTFAAQTGWLGSRQGKEIAESNRQLRTAKQQKKDEVATRKVQEEADRRKRCQDIMLGVAVGFSGGISSQKVGELRDIAYALGLEDLGTKETLIAQIKAHFDENPALKNRPMFSGLFASTRGHKRAAPDHNENENTPSNRPHTETASVAAQPLPPFENAIAGPSRMPLASRDHLINPSGVHDQFLQYITSSTYPQSPFIYRNNVHTFAQSNTSVNHIAIPSRHIPTHEVHNQLRSNAERSFNPAS
jgi:hypothetical protein